MKLKVCGLKFEENIADLMQLRINYMGFIFYKKSPLYVGEDFIFEFIR